MRWFRRFWDWVEAPARQARTKRMHALLRLTMEEDPPQQEWSDASNVVPFQRRKG